MFSHLLWEATSKPGFHHPIYAIMGITHLVYVDDLLLFTRVDKSTISLIVECLQLFGDVARLRANLLFDRNRPRGGGEFR